MTNNCINEATKIVDLLHAQLNWIINDRIDVSVNSDMLKSIKLNLEKELRTLRAHIAESDHKLITPLDGIKYKLRSFVFSVNIAGEDDG